MLIKKLFGEKKSIQRELMKNVIMVIIGVLAISIIFYYFAINYELSSKLHDVNFLDEVGIKELLAIARKNIIILIFSTFLLSGILMGIATKKMLMKVHISKS